MIKRYEQCVGVDFIFIDCMQPKNSMEKLKTYFLLFSKLQCIAFLVIGQAYPPVVFWNVWGPGFECVQQRHAQNSQKNRGVDNLLLF